MSECSGGVSGYESRECSGWELEATKPPGSHGRESNLMRVAILPVYHTPAPAAARRSAGGSASRTPCPCRDAPGPSSPTSSPSPSIAATWTVGLSPNARETPVATLVHWVLPTNSYIPHTSRRRGQELHSAPVRASRGGARKGNRVVRKEVKVSVVSHTSIGCPGPHCQRPAAAGRGGRSPARAPPAQPQDRFYSRPPNLPEYKTARARTSAV